MATTALAMISPEGGLSRYLTEIRKFPMLTKDEEFMLAKAWREHEDSEAAHRLVTSHLRLVAKIAMGYRGYGLPIGEVISEGNVGLMQAVKKFEPDKGFRLATYAVLQPAQSQERDQRPGGGRPAPRPRGLHRHQARRDQ